MMHPRTVRCVDGENCTASKDGGDDDIIIMIIMMSHESTRGSPAHVHMYVAYGRQNMYIYMGHYTKKIAGRRYRTENRSQVIGRYRNRSSLALSTKKGHKSIMYVLVLCFG